MSSLMHWLYSWRGALLNGALYQLVWLVAVVKGSVWAFGVLIPFFIVHAVYLVPLSQGGQMPVSQKKYLYEFWFLCLIAVAGFVLDSLWFITGILERSDTGLLAPAWLFAIWLAFAATLNHALKPLHGRYTLALILGAFAGPTTYSLGAALNPDINIGVSDFTFNLMLGGAWAVLFPLLLLVAHRYDRKYQTASIRELGSRDNC